MRQHAFGARLFFLAVRGLWLSALGFLTLLAAPANADEDTQSGVAFFESKIRPLLAARCYECHAQSAKQVQGGLRLDTPPASSTAAKAARFWSQANRTRVRSSSGWLCRRRADATNRQAASRGDRSADRMGSPRRAAAGSTTRRLLRNKGSILQPAENFGRFSRRAARPCRRFDKRNGRSGRSILSC